MKNYLIKIGNCIALCFIVVMFSHKIFCQQVDIQNQVDLMVSDEKSHSIDINNLLNLRNGFKKESSFRPDTIVILNKNVDEKFRFLYSYDSIKIL